MRLTPTHLAVLEFLTWQVRLATDQQIQQVLNAQEKFTCQSSRIMRQLATAGLVHRRRIAVAVPVLSQPLCCWFPGGRTPNFRTLAWRLFVRNEQACRDQTQVNYATTRAADLLNGVSGWHHQPLQLEHDLGTTAMYVASRLAPRRGRADQTRKVATKHSGSESEVPRRAGFSDCTKASIWYSEDIVRRWFHGVNPKIPDALIVDSDENVLRVMEYGGQYSRRRLESFHRHWKHLPWELW